MKKNIFIFLTLFFVASPVFSADIEYLLIGGGGGSGCGGSTNGGGNAGQLINSTLSTSSVGTLSITIGQKGYQDCTNSPYVGVSGTDTTFGSFTAVGGAGGTGMNTTTGGDGAGANNSGCSGGAGLSLAISTTTRYYAGGGSCYNAGGSNGSGYDWYGGGADANDGTPKKNGVVILRYLTSDVTATGGSTYTDGSYTIHVFETDDDFVISSIVAGGGSGTSTATSTALTFQDTALAYYVIISLMFLLVIINYYK